MRRKTEKKNRMRSRKPGRGGGGRIEG